MTNISQMEQISNVLMIQDDECFSFKFYQSNGKCALGLCLQEDARANVTGQSVMIHAQFDC